MKPVNFRSMGKPLQVYLEESEMAELERWATARGWTKSRAVRLAVRALVRGKKEDPLLSLSGAIDGLPAHLSERVDEELGGTFVAERSPRYGKRGKKSTTRLRR